MSAPIKIATLLLANALRFVLFSLRSRRSLTAENFFLRRQLALYKERRQTPAQSMPPLG